MEPTDTSAITEFAIVVVGFSGLVVAVVQRDGQIRPLDKYRTVTMLTYAFSAAFGSLLPTLADSFGLPETQLWWYSGLGLLLLLIGNVSATALFTLLQAPQWVQGAFISGLIWQLLLASILFTRLLTQMRSGSAND